MWSMIEGLHLLYVHTEVICMQQGNELLDLHIVIFKKKKVAKQ